MHEDATTSGLLGSTKGGVKRVKLTVAVINNDNVVSKKNFDSDDFSLKDMLASLGDNDSIVVKYESKDEPDFNPYPFGISPFGQFPFDQGATETLFFKFKKVTAIDI